MQEVGSTQKKTGLLHPVILVRMIFISILEQINNYGVSLLMNKEILMDRFTLSTLYNNILLRNCQLNIKKVFQNL